LGVKNQSDSRLQPKASFVGLRQSVARGILWAEKACIYTAFKVRKRGGRYFIFTPQKSFLIIHTMVKKNKIAGFPVAPPCCLCGLFFVGESSISENSPSVMACISQFPQAAAFCYPILICLCT